MSSRRAIKKSHNLPKEPPIANKAETIIPFLRENTDQAISLWKDNIKQAQFTFKYKMIPADYFEQDSDRIQNLYIAGLDYSALC